MRRSTVAAIALILAAACSRDGQREQSDSGASGQPPAGLGEGFAARVPSELRVRRGACPFECCVYREWTATGETPVFSSERDAGAPAFTMPAGQKFLADSGNVHVTGIALVVVTDSVGDPPYWSFAPGDTIALLDYVGEGFYHVWDGTRVQQVEAFWIAGGRPGAGELVGEHTTEWWTHVTLPDGRTGWVSADRSPRFGNADACGGPSTLP